MKTNEKNVAMFYTALQDCFKEDEDRELDSFGKIELENASGSELIFEMFTAVYMLFNNLHDGKYDTLDFLSLMNRMTFQETMEQQSKEAVECH